MRHIRFPRAAVAQEGPNEALKSTSTSQVLPVLWALNGLPASGGVCVALQVRGESIWVGLRTPSLKWVPLEQVLTKAQLAEWTTWAGFGR